MLLKKSNAVGFWQYTATREDFGLKKFLIEDLTRRARKSKRKWKRKILTVMTNRLPEILECSSRKNGCLAMMWYYSKFPARDPSDLERVFGTMAARYFDTLATLWPMDKPPRDEVERIERTLRKVFIYVQEVRTAAAVAS